MVKQVGVAKLNSRMGWDRDQAMRLRGYMGMGEGY